MLKDPRFKKSNEDLAFLLGITPVKHSRGVYTSSGFNLNHVISNKMADYPAFTRRNYEWYQDCMKRNKDAWYYKDMVEKMASVPENVESLYNRKNLKHLVPDDEYFELSSYGVVDSVEQLFSYYDFDGDSRNFCIGFQRVDRDISNKGRGGGWRWHKWGPYIGHQKPTTEYLDDEEFIDHVFVYDIIQLLT